MARAAPASPKRKRTSQGLRSAALSTSGDLTRYQEMRDFSKTPEPAGVRAAPGVSLRFVIQKHAARRLHYDFRLELDGVYKSWAVAKGPSLDPHVKRLAVPTEDHPIDYGDFEGVIPQGEYGGGTVMIWDRGFWRPEDDPAKAYAKGHLAFDLDGEKLHGRWHLIRTRPRPGEKKDQWLLFKSDDEYARAQADGDILETAPDSVATHRSIEEIAAEQDAIWSGKAGLVKGDLSPAGAASHPVPFPGELPKASSQLKNTTSASGGEKEQVAAVEAASPLPKDGVRGAPLKGVKRAPFPGFVEPCLAELAEKPPDGAAWVHEIKFDGYRLQAAIEGGRVRLYTRSGLDWTERFPATVRALADLPARSALIDGEAVVEDANGVSSFSALQEALSKRKTSAEVLFYAFDLLYLDGFDLREATLEARKEALAKLFGANGSAPLRYSDHIAGNGAAMLEHACRLGLEGVVSKRHDAPYRSGRRGEWLKSKCIDCEEFVIGGYAPSSATRNAIGSLALGVYDAGGLVYIGRTGTGFTQSSAQALHKALQALRIAKSPFANALSTEERRDLIFVEPKLVAEVEFRGLTQDKRLRQAAFKGLREDKPALEVRLEMPRRQTASAAHGAQKRTPAKSSKKSGETEFEGVRLTHPDRILWEGQGLTKLGLAEYYAGIADFILPHIAGRPLALVRCPSGQGGECFYQKHSFAGLMDAVEIAHVEELDGKPEEAIIIRDLRGLINLVQVNVLEIHPWGACIEEIDRPDTLIFDLDPGEGVAWDSVIEAAREVRRRLQEVGIESFVKTTGGKGLHVVSHLQPALGWDELKTFAHAIALAMERDSPARYLSTMAKKAREGKIFVDYLRNGRGSTAVAAYSTRARAGAPVSTPVRWDELGPALTASRYTVENIGRRMGTLTSDPWDGFFQNPQDLAKAARALKAPPRAKPVERRKSR